MGNAKPCLFNHDGPIRWNQLGMRKVKKLSCATIMQVHSSINDMLVRSQLQGKRLGEPVLVGVWSVQFLQWCGCLCVCASSVGWIETISTILVVANIRSYFDVHQGTRV